MALSDELEFVTTKISEFLFVALVMFLLPILFLNILQVEYIERKLKLSGKRLRD